MLRWCGMRRSSLMDSRRVERCWFRVMRCRPLGRIRLLSYRAAMMVARGNILAFAERRSCLRSGSFSSGGWRKDGADRAFAGECGLLCSGWAVSAAFYAADDGDSGSGGWGGADCGLLAEACEGDDGGGMAGGSDGVLSCGWGAGDLSYGLWNRDGFTGGQDCWSGEFICD